MWPFTGRAVLPSTGQEAEAAQDGRSQNWRVGRQSLRGGGHGPRGEARARRLGSRSGDTGRWPAVVCGAQAISRLRSLEGLAAFSVSSSSPLQTPIQPEFPLRHFLLTGTSCLGTGWEQHPLIFRHGLLPLCHRCDLCLASHADLGWNADVSTGTGCPPMPGGSGLSLSSEQKGR